MLTPLLLGINMGAVAWDGGAGVAVFLAAGLVLLLSLRGDAPLVREGLLGSSGAIPLHLANGVSAVAVLAALWHRRYRLAGAAVAMQVSLILWGWALAQHPYLLPPDFTVQRSTAPPVTLRLAAVALAIGGLAAAVVTLSV